MNITIIRVGRYRIDLPVFLHLTSLHIILLHLTTTRLIFPTLATAPEIFSVPISRWYEKSQSVEMKKERQAS